MVVSECKPLSNLEYKAKCIFKGPSQHANHREEEDAREGQETHTVFIPLQLLLRQSDRL